MKIPGFTAEASISNMNDCYRTAGSREQIGKAIHPAQAMRLGGFNQEGIYHGPPVMLRCKPSCQLKIDKWGNKFIICGGLVCE